jgi:hypothetical protein
MFRNVEIYIDLSKLINFYLGQFQFNRKCSILTCISLLSVPELVEVSTELSHRG